MVVPTATLESDFPPLLRFLAPVTKQAGVFEIPAECVANLLNEFASLRLARLED
jgi:hypothetical protein